VKIGIYGGTFNPPHLGHVNGALTAAKKCKLDKLLIIPTSVPPHKEAAKLMASPDDRLRMCSLAMEDIPCAEVSDIEIKRGGKSFTVDTVSEILQLYPDSELYLFMGTDMATTFEKWRSYREIMEKCTLCAFSRHDGDRKEIEKSFSSYEEKYGAKTKILDTDIVDISSTSLRELFSKRDGNKYLPENVYSYIIEKRLYDAKPNFEWLREKAYSMLKPKRIPHVKGCEGEAARLAERWGDDIDDAREAAILHDITKKEDLAGQLILCSKYDIIVDNAEKESSALLHSKTGAAIAKYVFGCSERVVSAIKWHTTGRANMTLLEKIIYLADFIEPTRSFEGLDEVRKLAYIDLDRAMEKAYCLSLQDMKERGIEPHKNTIEALEAVRTKSKDRGT
jgi:nicotinate-nucleotide adenylyltransferase